MTHGNSRSRRIQVFQVRQVRRLTQEGWSQRDIAAHTGLSQSTVFAVLHNKGWYGRVQMRQKVDSPGLQRKMTEKEEERFLRQFGTQEEVEARARVITQDKKGVGGPIPSYTQAIKDYHRLALWTASLDVGQEEAFTYLPKVLEVLAPFLGDANVAVAFNGESIPAQ